MYELWLMLNILWEVALSAWPMLLAAALLWLVLMGITLRTAGARWSASLPSALLIGGIAAFAAFLLLPRALSSTLSDLGYWVDWVTLIGLALAVGGAVAAYASPLLARRRGLGHR